MFRRLVWLAVGAFAIGTETYVVAALLPSVASDLHVSVTTAGQVVTIFALGYAIGSPLLTVVSGNAERKWLLVSCLAGFAFGNLLAATAQSFGQLAAARALLALTAGLYVPTATAVAAALVSPEKRGRAIAFVIGGMTIAVTLGTPAGALIGGYATWRATFLMVAAISAFAALGLAFGLPRGLPHTVTTLAQRLAVGKRPEILHALAVTLSFATGVFAVFTFLATVLIRAAGFGADGISAAMFAFGIGAAAGNALGGIAADKFGPMAAARAGLAILAIDFAVLTWAATALPPDIAGIVLLVTIAVWGAAGWGFYAAQMANVARLAADVAPVALSLNASTFYLGVAAGSALGAVTLAVGGYGALGWVAMAGQVVALIIMKFAPARMRQAAAAAGAP